MKIGIIGAGVAGLTAAFELRKFGLDVTIFEATNRVGGRVFTYYFDKEKKLYGELGAMRFPITHKYTMHYINKFNIEVEPFPQTSKETFIYIKGVRVRNDEDGLSVSEYIYPLFPLCDWEKNTKWFDLIDYIAEYPICTMPQNVTKEIVQIKNVYSPYINYWDCISTKKAMRVLGLSVGAIDMLSSINPTVFPFWYDSHIEILNEYYTGAFKNLMRIKGGFSRLPDAFYSSLTNKEPIDYGDINYDSLGKIDFKFTRPVRGIYYDKISSKITLRSSDSKYQNLKDDVFDYVICAIPFSSLRNVDISPVFSSTKYQSIREINYTESQKTLFLCNKRFWQDQGIIDGGGSVTDLPIASIWYPREGKIDEPAVFLASYNLNKDARRLGTQPIEIRVEMIKRQVEKVHGLPENYLDDIVEGFASINWGDEPYELGCFAYFQPEQKRLFSKAMTTPEFDNKIYFAGEHLSVFHGWQNGAFETAIKATQSIIKNIGMVNNLYDIYR